MCWCLFVAASPYLDGVQASAQLVWDDDVAEHVASMSPLSSLLDVSSLLASAFTSVEARELNKDKKVSVMFHI